MAKYHAGMYVNHLPTHHENHQRVKQEAHPIITAFGKKHYNYTFIKSLLYS